MDALSLAEYLGKMKSLVNKKFESSNANKEMSLAELRLLLQIYREPSLEMQTQSLANINTVTIAAIMHKLKLLEDKGYVVKKNSLVDQRIKIYTLTPKAIEFAEGFKRKIDLYNERLLESFQASEVEALEAILKKIILFMEEN